MRPSAPEGTFTLGGDLTVRRMGFGAMRLTGAGIWGDPPNHHECQAVLRRAVELGVGLIDTADSYGPGVSERIIAETLHPYPAGVVIATKGGLLRGGPDSWIPDCRPEHLRTALEGSLKVLRLERIDVYQLHTVDPKVPFADSLGELRRLRDEGKIRHVALSNVDVPRLEQARRIVPIVSVQNRYNLTERRSDPVVDYCEREGLGFLPWFPLGAGRVAQAGGPLARVAQRRGATPTQVALAWLLGRARCMLPIPGTAKVRHLEENVAAAALSLTDDDRRELEG
ncbi:MAG TPA: aldo/keto reductase [Polyangia bacterium]|jgi:aryl-alcohol dehydrogenase-like predicted oxidoreductase